MTDHEYQPSNGRKALEAILKYGWMIVFLFLIPYMTSTEGRLRAVEVRTEWILDATQKLDKKITKMQDELNRWERWRDGRNRNPE